MKSEADMTGLNARANPVEANSPCALTSIGSPRDRTGKMASWTVCYRHLPSPRENRHWFYRETVAVYRFHTSVTDPSNVFLTQQQRAAKQFDAFTNLGILYRF